MYYLCWECDMHGYLPLQHLECMIYVDIYHSGKFGSYNKAGHSEDQIQKNLQKQKALNDDIVDTLD